MSVNQNDIDVIIEPGYSIGAVVHGGSRIRVRGPVVGSHSGGLMGQLRDFGGNTDVTIDGIDMNGHADFGAVAEGNQVFRTSCSRMAIMNTRAIAAGYLWLGSARHVIIANCNLFHGAAARADVGFVEGWGIRNTGGPITILGSRVQGTRYHNIRAQSDDGVDELLYIGSGSVLVAVHEGRAAWLWNNLNNTSTEGNGAIIEDSKIYSAAQPGCSFGHEISAPNCIYTRVRNNEFFSGGNSNYTQAYLDTQAANAGGSPGDHDWSVGNAFFPLGELPAWGGPGDPTLIPLPAGLALELNGESPCPIFP